MCCLGTSFFLVCLAADVLSRNGFLILILSPILIHLRAAGMHAACTLTCACVVCAKVLKMLDRWKTPTSVEIVLPLGEYRVKQMLCDLSLTCDLKDKLEQGSHRAYLAKVATGKRCGTNTSMTPR